MNGTDVVKVIKNGEVYINTNDGINIDRIERVGGKTAVYMFSKDYEVNIDYGRFKKKI